MPTFLIFRSGTLINTIRGADPRGLTTAIESAALTTRISQACSDASYLRVMLGLLLPFFGLIFVPMFSLIGAVGFWFLKIAIPIMLIVWWVKFGKIKTPDPDFSKARGTTFLVAGIWFLAFVLTLPVFHW